MKRASALFIVAFVLAGLAVYQYVSKDGTSTAAAVDFKPKAGSVAAEFQLPGLDEKAYEVGGKQDKLSFVNFWASWCGPCELEAPDLQTLQEKYGDEINLYGVNATKFDKERSAREFVQEHEFTFPILMDRSGDVTKQYKVNTFPTTFLIDSEGVIRERINGVITIAEWERLIAKYK
ncbi:TlpA family protein disulfide reductase [Paenibacillus radicis (ex Gao et al. 2016)]|uniref:Thioredoxin n=1 Tax=Paenibacillus radicis (ex Gao et al. 2016) TaxID=1737354 RepID=A0A917GSU3_9BACL|nr:TlpA disulfide reductase family protein [Paenibacillus radicis (ex Gao et al. 2016)]GGG55815.1 thioredoxin [Paenibacillus radicis (ex Gao et al. 2016)]